ncbi:MAG: tRNA (adenosine(37)-N6)-threonylcarbamoyltransferase complex ATPase subunit type 1 TsaE [Nitrospinota bacterium]
MASVGVRARRATKSARETEELGAALADEVREGGVVLLTGELGSGKTCFIRGLVRALEGGEGVRVRSPSFTLVHFYPTTPPAAHVDLYRIGAEEDLETLGLEELFSAPGRVVLVEWADRLGAWRPEGALEVQLEHRGADRREVWIKGPADSPEPPPRC